MNIRKDFPFFKNNNETYLDSAASSLKPKCVSDAISKYYLKYGSNIDRGIYQSAIEATIIYEESRNRVAKFINASPKEVIFTKGATNSLNMIALSYGMDNVEENDEIIISEAEHHSHILPWQRVAKLKKAKLIYVPLNKDGSFSIEKYKKCLSNKTKVVALAQISNVLGYEIDIKEVIRLAHEVGAVVSVDACQSAPHIKIDVKDLDCDFLSFSFHKMCGPTGVGILYGKEELLNKMEPVELGGDMNDEVYKYKVTYKELPHKFEAGTQNIAGVFGVKETLDYLESINYLELDQKIRKLTKYTINKLKKIDGLTIYTKASKATSIIAFNIENVHAHDAVTFFAASNIDIRAGHHCAELMHNFLNVSATLRASFYLYSNKKDADIFIKTVQEAVNFFKELGF